MKNIKIYSHTVLLLLIGLAFISCNDASRKEVKSQQIPIVDFKGLQPLLSMSNDTTYVINFWATWCAPCVKEIPHFEKLNDELKGSKIRVILVNLDFPNQYENRLIPFIEQHKIRSTVVMLDDPNSNFWINEISPKWSGSIPGTLIYNRIHRDFYEKEFNYEELKETVSKYL